MNPPQTNKQRKRGKGKRVEGRGALVEELDMMSDVVFCLNLPQQVQRRATRVVKSPSSSSKVSTSQVPISVTFRARRYPVCTSAFPKESDEKNQVPLGDVDELLGWPALHHTVSWIRGVHILDLNKIFKKNISRKNMMQDVVARIGGRATLDLVFPPLSRDNFQRMIQDEYEGSRAVADLLAKGMEMEAEAMRKQEIVVMVDSRTRKSWGANRIVPVWFLIWILEWDYLRPHFSSFNTKFGVCFQIADAMRCKMQTGVGSNDADRELLAQSRKIIKSMEIVSNRGNLTLLQNRTRDLVSVDMACRRLFNRRERPWRSGNTKKSLAEAEEVFSGTSSSNGGGGGDGKNKDDSMSVRVTDLEEAFDVEIIAIGSTIERLKGDIRMLALKCRGLEKQQKNSSQAATPSIKIIQNDAGASDRPDQRFLSAYDSNDEEEEEEEGDSDYSSSDSDSSDDDEEQQQNTSSSASEESEAEEVLKKQQRKRPRWMKRQQQRYYQQQQQQRHGKSTTKQSKKRRRRY